MTIEKEVTMPTPVSTVNNVGAARAPLPMQVQQSALSDRASTGDLAAVIDTLHTALRANPEINTDLLSKVRTLIRSALDIAGSTSIDRSGIIPATERSAEFTPGGLLAWQCRAVEKLMTDRLGDKLKIEDMARAVRLSPSYFTQAFRTTYGMPPKRFLMRLRIREAQKCLLAKQPQLCDLALQCGFSDQAHFTRVFHDVAGETPRRWLGLRLQQSSLNARATV